MSTPTSTSQPDARPEYSRLHEWWLIALMALGSITLWLLSPVFWIWLAAQMVSSSQPTMGPYLLVIVGIGVSVVAIAKGLGVLDRKWAAVTGAEDGRKVERSWHKSLRGGRDSGRRKSILDVVMGISVVTALGIFGFWWAVFAGSPLPSG